MSRALKQIIYGAFYLVVIGFFVYLGYGTTLRPDPSCVDGIQNRDEVEVDCGGAFCIACEIKRLRPIAIVPIGIVPAAQANRSSLVLEIRNPNAAYGATAFAYVVNVIAPGSSTPVYQEFGSTAVYPAEVKSRVSVNIDVPFSDTLRVFATTTAPYTWQSIQTLVKPRIITRDIRELFTGQQGVVTGILRNDNAFALKRATINVFAHDGTGALRAVSKTIVQDLTALEERAFRATIGLPVPAETITGLDLKLSIEAER